MKTKSSQPRKQRKFRFTAPLHLAANFLNAHLSKELRQKLKKRSVRVRKGDTVKITKGKYAGVTGKVTGLGKAVVNVEGAVVKKMGGKETPVPISASNILIMQMVERK